MSLCLGGVSGYHVSTSQPAPTTQSNLVPPSRPTFFPPALPESRFPGGHLPSVFMYQCVYVYVYVCVSLYIVVYPDQHTP